MGLGFSPWGDKGPLAKVARTHARDIAEEYRKHLADLNEKRTNTLEAAAAFDLLGDISGHMKAIALAAEIDTAIERAEANLGEWST